VRVVRSGLRAGVSEVGTIIMGQVEYARTHLRGMSNAIAILIVEANLTGHAEAIHDYLRPRMGNVYAVERSIMNQGTGGMTVKEGSLTTRKNKGNMIMRVFNWLEGGNIYLHTLFRSMRPVVFGKGVISVEELLRKHLTSMTAYRKNASNPALPQYTSYNGKSDGEDDLTMSLAVLLEGFVGVLKKKLLVRVSEFIA